MTEEGPRARYERRLKEQEERIREDEAYAMERPEADRPRIREVQAEMRRLSSREDWLTKLDRPLNITRTRD